MKIIPLKKIINKIASKHFSKKEKTILLLIFLIFAVAGYFLFILWAEQYKQQGLIIQNILPTTKPSTISQEAREAPAGKDGIPVRGEASAFRDPFLPSNKIADNKIPIQVQKKALIGLKVSGILWDKMVPSAIINSKVVKIGDLISGKTVVDIEQDKVIVMEDGEIYILKLKK